MMAGGIFLVVTFSLMLNSTMGIVILDTYFFTNYICTFPLTHDGTRTVIRFHFECFAVCGRHASCLSAIYDKTANECVTYDMIVHTSNDTCSPSGLLYGEKKVFRSIGEGESCTKDIQCAMENSECRDNLCQCWTGYSYKASTQECLTYCSTYGDTFHEDKDHFIDMFNEVVMFDFTLEECKMACLSATNFTCRSLELDRGVSDVTGTCYLHSETAFTQPQAYFFSERYALYQRNCA